MVVFKLHHLLLYLLPLSPYPVILLLFHLSFSRSFHCAHPPPLAPFHHPNIDFGGCEVKGSTVGSFNLLTPPSEVTKECASEARREGETEERDGGSQCGSNEE